MRLLVVILNYRVTDLTIECLRSLEPHLSEVPEARVVVCENGTGGDAAERLQHAIESKGWGSWAELTVVSPNLGFTGGNNVVVRQALASADPPEYVLLLNADTIVLPGALKGLVDVMDRHPRAGIAGSRLLSPSGEPQSSPFRFHSVASEFERGLRLGIVTSLLGRWVVTPRPPPKESKVEWVAGASMILRSSMLREIGLLDEGLFTYFDDVDLCLRARRSGWQTWYTPASRVVHLEGASTGVNRLEAKRRPKYWFQARRRFFLKNYGAAYTACADAAFILGYATWRARRRVQRMPDGDPPRLLADFVQNSVFLSGIRITDVENPALSDKTLAEVKIRVVSISPVGPRAQPPSSS